MGDGSGGNASDGERWGAAEEALLVCLPLASSCAAWFLIARGPALVCDWGLGTPALSPGSLSSHLVSFMGSPYDEMIATSSSVSPCLYASDP